MGRGVEYHRFRHSRHLGLREWFRDALYFAWLCVVIVLVVTLVLGIPGAIVMLWLGWRP